MPSPSCYNCKHAQFNHVLRKLDVFRMTAMSPVHLPKDKPGYDIQIIDKTQPIATEDFQCAWGHEDTIGIHIIPKGHRYVRIVYKLNGKFESDHICIDCWCGKPTNE